MRVNDGSCPYTETGKPKFEKKKKKREEKAPLCREATTAPTGGTRKPKAQRAEMNTQKVGKIKAPVALIGRCHGFCTSRQYLG